MCDIFTFINIIKYTFSIIIMFSLSINNILLLYNIMEILQIS